MSTIPHQVIDFLKQSAPFDVFDKDTLLHTAKHTKVIYLTDDNQEEVLDEHCPALFLIQSGQFIITDERGKERHLSEGDYFGFIMLLDPDEGKMQVTVDSPGVIYCFSPEVFKQRCENKSFLGFFTAARDDVVENQAVANSNAMWLYKPLHEMLHRAPIQIEQTLSIKAAAEVMSDEGVSSLIVTEDDHLIGIVTDRDLRNRVVATGLDITLPVDTIMTSSPAYILHNQNMFAAIALMSEKNIHHLPVLHADDRSPVGMVTTSDVVRQQRSNVLFMIGELSKTKSLYELTRVSWQMPQYFAANAKRAGDFDIAGKVLSQGTDVMTRKLIDFFVEINGTPPMKYCWVVYGSQAREDQTMGSDQDNALLLEREPTPREAEYFAAFAEYVCKGLGKCGIKLCDGNIMASNPDLRLSLNQAVTQAKKWIRSTTPEAILEFNIFLDSRAVAGDRTLFKRLQQLRKPILQDNIFLAALARNSNQESVPLSMFNKLVTKKHNGKSDCINIKVNAVALVNNLARLHALKAGLTIPGTIERFNILGQIGEMNQKDANNLRDIWLFLNRLRWRHQLSNNASDNFVSMSDLSSIEKHQLKAAFKSIDRAQQSAVLKFSGGIS
jgi:CBS domain-containing protein